MDWIKDATDLFSGNADALNELDAISIWREKRKDLAVTIADNALRYKNAPTKMKAIVNAEINKMEDVASMEIAVMQNINDRLYDIGTAESEKIRKCLIEDGNRLASSKDGSARLFE